MVKELNTGSDYDSVLNVDKCLRYIAACTALSNLDSYLGPPHNYYVYEQGDGIFEVIPWDLNLSFGIFKMGCDTSFDTTTLTILEPTTGSMSNKPLVDNLLTAENYAAYYGYLTDIINGPMEATTLNNSINGIDAVIRTHVQADPTSFYGFTAYTTNLTSTYIIPGRNTEVHGLRSFAADRIINVNAQLSGALPKTGGCR